MAFLRIEQKKSGTYLRIVQSFKQNGVTRHKTNTHQRLKLEVSTDCTPQGITNQHFT